MSPQLTPSPRDARRLHAPGLTTDDADARNIMLNELVFPAVRGLEIR